MQFLKIVFIFCVVVLSLPVFAQNNPARRNSRIIDDSTKQVYGPRTSRYFYEKDVFYNRFYKHPLDTAIHNYHRFNFVQGNNNLYQDLGNIGTAIRPIFYQTSALIGVTSGFNAYDLYWDVAQVKYYDTKSPYSDLKIIWGGLGRSITNVEFSRNINPRWNFGFSYRSLLIDKQINRTGKGDRNVKANYYDFYTSYHSKDSTYRIFFNFRRSHTQADENGGVDTVRNNGDRFIYKNFFDKLTPIWLTNAESRDRRDNIHLFHQYQIFGKGFQVYHIFDNYHQHNNFYDGTESNGAKYFDWTNDELDSTATTVHDGARLLRCEMKWG